MPALNARALPHNLKPLVSNRNQALVVSERSLVFTNRVLPAKTSASPSAGGVPAQLAPVLQLSSPPPPDQVSCARNRGVETAVKIVMTNKYRPRGNAFFIIDCNLTPLSRHGAPSMRVMPRWGLRV